MRLRRVRLQNYRRYADQSIEFPDGLIGIVGENGAGKTTILEAVALGLYGPEAARTSKEFVKREGAPAQVPCRVELEFELGGDAYRVVRELRGATLQPSAVLYKNEGGAPEAETSSAVTDRIRRLLGLDLKSFFTSVFARQKELNALSDATPGERKKRVLRMLKIALVDVALTNLRSDRRISDEMVKRLQEGLQDVDAMGSTLASLQRDVAEQQAKISRLRAERKRAESALGRARAEADRWRAIERKHRAAEADVIAIEQKFRATERALGDLDTEITDLREKRRALPKLRALSRAYGAATAEDSRLRDIQLKYNARSVASRKLEDALASGREALVQAKELARDVKAGPRAEWKQRAIKGREKMLLKEAKELEKTIGDLGAQVKNLKVAQRDLRAHLQTVKDLGPESSCPVCGRLLGKLHPKLSATWKGQLAKLNQDLSAKQAALVEAEKSAAGVDETLRRLQKELRDLDELVLQRAKDLQRISDLRREAAGAKEKVARLRKELSEFGRISYSTVRHAETRKRLKALTVNHEKYLRAEQDVRRLPKLVSKRGSRAGQYSAQQRAFVSTRKRLLAIGYEPSEHAAATRTFEKQRRGVESLQRGIVEARGELKLRRHKVTEQRHAISQEMKKRITIEREKRKTADLAVLEEAFLGFRLDLVSRIRPMLAWRTGELLRTLTRGRYPEVELDEDYELHIRDEGKLFPLPRFSGGEEDLASLCLRIAISQVIAERGGATPMNFIVLDEIFGSQDAARRANILRSLKHLSEQFRQVILITHVEDVKDALPFALLVSLQNNGTSSVTLEGSPMMAG